MSYDHWPVSIEPHPPKGPRQRIGAQIVLAADRLNAIAIRRDSRLLAALAMRIYKLHPWWFR